MGAPLTDDDGDPSAMFAFLDGDDPLVEPVDHASRATDAPNASIDDSEYERDEREAIQGTAAAVGQARPCNAPKAEKPLMVEIKPNAQSAKTNAPKAERREQSVDMAEDEFDADPSLRPNPKMICKSGAEDGLTERGKLLLDREKNWYARGPEIVTTIRSGEKGSIIIAPVAYSVFLSRLILLLDFVDRTLAWG